MLASGTTTSLERNIQRPTPQIVFGFHDADGWLSRYACLKCTPGTVLKAQLFYPSNESGSGNALHVTVSGQPRVVFPVPVNISTELVIALPQDTEDKMILVHFHSAAFRTEEAPGVRLLGLVLSELRLERAPSS